MAIRQRLRQWQGLFQKEGGAVICFRAPFAPLLDALDHYIGGQEPRLLKTELAGCDWLVRLLPELAGGPLPPLPDRALPPAQERRLLFAAVRQFLTNIGSRAAADALGGTLLVLDDLQWAEPDALDLLAALIHAAAAIRLRVVAGYQDTAVHDQEALAMLRADLAVAGLAAQHSLRPLAVSAATQLLNALLPNSVHDVAFLADTLRRAEGTPFYLVSYAQALLSGPAETVPWDVTQSVRQRFATLPAAGRDLLSTAAVIGRHVPRPLLATVTGQTEEAMLPGLEAVCRARLLIEDGDSAYTFTHDVIREVVEIDVGAARRAVLHRRVATALAEEPAHVAPERLAYHFARGGVSAQAARYAELAGDQAWQQRASAAAEHHYREALAHLSASQALEAARVREKLGEVLYRTGRHLAAIDALEPATTIFTNQGTRQDLARVVALIGWAYARESRPEEGLARIQPAIATLEVGTPPPGPAALAALYEAKGQLLFAAGQLEESLAAHNRSAEFAEQSGDDRLRMLAAGQRTTALQRLGRFHEAIRTGEAALPLAESIGDLAILWKTYDNLADAYLFQGTLRAAERSIERAGELSAQMGDPGLQAISLASRALIAMIGGDRPRARADLTHAQALAEAVSWPVSLAHVRIGLARLALDANDLALAAHEADTARAMAGTTSDVQVQRRAVGVSAEVDIRAGHPEVAVARILPLCGPPSTHEYSAIALMPVLARAYLDQGDLGQADAITQQALSLTRPEAMRLVQVEALQIQTLVALHTGAWAEARDLVTEGLNLAQDIGYRAAETEFRRLDQELVIGFRAG